MSISELQMNEGSAEQIVEDVLWDLGKEKPEVRAVVGELISFLRSRSKKIVEQYSAKELEVIKENISRNLRRRRKAAFMTAADLSNKISNLTNGELQLTTSAIYSWERGRNQLREPLISIVAQALGCTVEDLMTQSSENPLDAYGFKKSRSE